MDKGGCCIKLEEVENLARRIMYQGESELSYNINDIKSEFPSS